MKRSLFRYYGGKWRVAPWIVSFFPKHEKYIEPFCGAASVFFAKKKADREVLNDINLEIVNFYRVCQDKQMYNELLHLLNFTPYSREEYNLSHTPHSNAIESARRLLVRATMCYNADAVTVGNKSGFRNDIHRRYTAPAHDWASYTNALPLFVERLRGVVIENMDVFKMFDKWGTADDVLWYLDPPYLSSTRKNNGNYKFEMSDSEHEKLLASIKKLPGMVIISGYDSDMYNDFLQGWKKESRVYGNHTYNSARTECIWINQLAKQKLEE